MEVTLKNKFGSNNKSALTLIKQKRLMFSRYYKIMYQIGLKRDFFEAKGCRSGKAAFDKLKATIPPERWGYLIIDYIQRVY